jgi:hypothetical protein
MRINRTRRRSKLTRRLLLLSCSRQKRRTRKPLPAVERYDGPAFRVVRRYLERQGADGPDVFILSAKWGLISGSTLLPYYDRRLTAHRAGELREQVRVQLRKILASRPREVFILMGESYFQLVDLEGLSQIAGAEIRAVRGSRGRKLSALYDWLYGAPPPEPRIIGSISTRGRRAKVKLRGVEIGYNRKQALALARHALRQEADVATRIHSWYVRLGPDRVSPKWLVGKISGLPVNAFVTDEARRVLAQLGIEVQRASDWRGSGLTPE